MKRRLGCEVSLRRSLATILLLAATQHTVAEDAITVWLMPNEPALEDREKPYDRRTLLELQQAIESLTVEHGPDDPVELVNLTDRDLLEQLLVLSRDFNTLTLPVVAGQTVAVDTLRRFAAEHGVHVKLRIVNWQEAYPESVRLLRGGNANGNDDTGDRQAVPDVLMVGTTWRQAYIDAGWRQVPTATQKGRLVWQGARPVAGEAGRPDYGTLPFLCDLRLLHYWRRMPREENDAPSFEPRTESWEALLASLEADARARPPEQRHPPLVLPVYTGTTNLLHDYAPLVWDGGGSIVVADGNLVDFSSERALRVPLLLSAFSVRRFDGERHGHRLVSFPEMNHNEAGHWLAAGHFGMAIQQVTFVHEFHRQFRERFEQLRFEDYVGVAVPPSAFIGGSDLMVTRRAERPDRLTGIAFAAARTLARGPYAEYLATRGQLPIQLPDYGVDRLVAAVGTIDDGPGDRRGPAGEGGVSERFRRELRSSILTALDAEFPLGREYAPSPHWPTVIESTPTRERLQGLWRRIAEQADETTIREAAREVEDGVNVQTNTWVRAWHAWLVWWPWVMTVVGLAGIVVGGYLARVSRQRHRALKAERDALVERNAASDERNKALAFTSMPLTLVDEFHKKFHFPFYAEPGGRAKKEKELKSAWVLNSLRELRRAHARGTWDDRRLADVVWTSLLHAVDSIRDPGLFNAWYAGWDPEQPPGECIPAFLGKNGERSLLRDDPEVVPRSAAFHFDVELSEPDRLVRLPFLFEQALACVLQNSLQASRNSDLHLFHSVSVRFEEGAVVVRNHNVSKRGIPPRLTGIVKAAPPLPEFAQAIEAVFREELHTEWPGMGLVHSYAIAREFFGGLRIESGAESTCVAIPLEPVPPPPDSLTKEVRR